MEVSSNESQQLPEGNDNLQANWLDATYQLLTFFMSLLMFVCCPCWVSEWRRMKMRKLQIDVSCEGCCAKKQKKNTSQLDFFPFVSTSSLVAHSFRNWASEP